MMDDSTAPITDADIRTLAAKLKGLHALLTPGEQALLHSLLRRAAKQAELDGSDTGGFGWMVQFNPFTYLDAVAGDLSSEGDAHRS